MDHPERDGREDLDHEVAVRDRVERVRGDAVEAELRCGRLAVERVARSREGAGPQRRDVEPPPRVGKPATVALGHLDVGEEMVREQDGLGGLDVRRAGQDRVAVAFGQADQRALERDERGVEPVDRAAQPQAQVRGDLVVPRAAGVELAGHRPDPLGQGHLEVQVDVLELGVPLDGARRDVLGEGVQALDQRRQLVLGDEPGASEPADVRDGARQVVRRELAIHLDRSRERGDALVARLAEPSAPDPHPSSVGSWPPILPGCARSFLA